MGSSKNVHQSVVIGADILSNTVYCQIQLIIAVRMQVAIILVDMGEDYEALGEDVSST